MAIRILFIGNSYTYFNEMPLMVEAMATVDGTNAQVESSVAGGYSLAQHADPCDPVGAVTLAKLQEPWDFVILQEQSRRPAIPRERDEQMRPTVGRLNDMVTALGGKTILYMTWGRRHGDPETGYSTYDEMQDAIAQAYADIGAQYDTGVAPVGLAFRRALDMRPDIELWDADNSHPSLQGSLLAAYVIYEAITGMSPLEATYCSAVPPADDAVLREAAHQAAIARQCMQPASQGSRRNCVMVPAHSGLSACPRV